MTVPSKKDLALKKGKLEGHLKLLQSDGTMSEKRLVAMIRGAIRQVWMKAPNKLAKLEMERVPDMNPKTRTKWLFPCAICKGMFKEADIEVDHIKGNHKFTAIADLDKYCENILNVPPRKMQILCKKGCHPIKTLAEARGITFEAARFEKKVISFTKLKADKQITVLGKYNIAGKNGKVREEHYRRLLKEGYIV
jgi:hypothetical protein